MKGLLLTLAALAGAVSLTVGLTGGFAATRATGTKVAVANTGLGRVLVDRRGRTLYLFEKDKHGKSACNGQCASFWPPLIATGKPIASAGVKASLLGTVKRADGRRQVTYRHHPLYTFVKDKRKGQTKGEEVDAFGAEWYAVSPAGKKVEKEEMSSGGSSGSSSSGSSSTPAPGYGSGY